MSELLLFGRSVSLTLSPKVLATDAGRTKAQEFLFREKKKIMSKETVIANKCYLRITANNGWRDKKYAVLCILDAIQEANTQNITDYETKEIECDKCGWVGRVAKHIPLKQAWCGNCRSPHIRLYKYKAGVF